MLKLKRCPKCRGDIVVDRDHYGWYEQCLYCGYLCDLGSIDEMKRQTNETEENEECTTRGKSYRRVS